MPRPIIQGTKMNFKSAVWRPGLTLAACLSASGALAQNYPRIAPQSLPTAAVAPPAAPATPRESGSDSIVVPSLRGLVFVAGRDQSQPGGLDRTGVAADGLPLLRDARLTARLNAFIGKPLTFRQLHVITDLIVARYRAKGHPVVKVFAPEQDVHTGVIQIVVEEFHVGKVIVDGARWFTPGQISGPFRMKAGDEVRSNRIIDGLDAANANPFRKVELVFKPGTAVGETDLILKTQDRFPVRVYAGYDNSGARVTGRDRWSLGANWGNAFGLDQQLSYQFTSSSDFWRPGPKRSSGSDAASFLSHSLSWSAPLPWGDRLMIFGAYEQTNPNVGQDFGLLGKSGQASLRYVHAVSFVPGARENVQFGFDFKTANNNLDFGGTQVSSGSTEIAQFLGVYSLSATDRFGTSSLTQTLVYSPGHLTGANTDAAFQPNATQFGRFGATADYVYAHTEIDRVTRLPFGALWTLRLIGQVSSKPLLDTEQLSVGGPDLLRGYEPNSINGDEGVIVSNEIRTRDVAILRSVPQAQIHALAFVDNAALWNLDAQPGDIGHTRATSAGVGLRLNLATYAAVKFDYGWQLNTVPGETRRGDFGSLSIIVGY